MKNSIQILLVLLLFSSCQDTQQNNSKRSLEQSGAGLSLDFWAYSRSYPSGQFEADKWEAAYTAHREVSSLRDTEANWSAIGPMNIGGRTLCLAFHPTEENTIFAGSASGGLWKTTTAGEGYVGWERMEIDFPVLGVPGIAINPNNPDEMYIGTGEVYNNQSTMPGVVNRLTRGSYGVGILKTTDGGLTWQKSLDWDYSDLTGVSEVVISPSDSETVFAATSEGFYRSTDGGANWELKLDIPMTYHIAVDPNNANKIFVTVGSYFNENSGIYMSEDGGENFNLLANGAPSGYTGKARIKIHPTETNIVYCSASDATNVGSYGMYKSEDGGSNWSLVSNENIPTYQGWYAHDVAVDPQNSNTTIWVGVDLYKSTNGGAYQQKSYWYNWDFGQTPVGGPEGPGDYVHADIHAVYWHPTIENLVFAATDGGVFVSSDNGETWEGRNGSFLTTQFYADFNSSNSNVNRAIGGMQDNSTAIYLGEDSWRRVIGGDGGSAAFHPTDDNRMLGTVQYLNLRRSTDGGFGFSNITPSGVNNEYTCFIAPIAQEAQVPNTIYAGAQHLYRSTNFGNSWSTVSIGFPDGLNPILTIATSLSSPRLYISTVANPFINNPEPGKVFRLADSGNTWIELQGLPDRVCSDIAVHPTNDDIVLATFSGFGTAHLYLTTDGGETWTAIEEGLPDVPTNNVIFDPEYPELAYVANDLGVYLVENLNNPEAITVSPYQTGLPSAVLAVSLDIQDSDRKLRVATHGNGVWESDLVLPVSSVGEADAAVNSLKLYPNPASEQINFDFFAEDSGTAFVSVFDIQGKLVLEQEVNLQTGQQSLAVLTSKLIPGTYLLTLKNQGQVLTGKFEKR